jgi:hypothetical protein
MKLISIPWWKKKPSGACFCSPKLISSILPPVAKTTKKQNDRVFFVRHLSLFVPSETTVPFGITCSLHF